jgi:hypothetical protein
VSEAGANEANQLPLHDGMEGDIALRQHFASVVGAHVRSEEYGRAVHPGLIAPHGSAGRLGTRSVHDS